MDQVPDVLQEVPEEHHQGPKGPRGKYIWAPEETRRLIRFRSLREMEFLQSRMEAKKQWEYFVIESGMEGKVTGQQASKKWENLKKRYKDVITTKTRSRHRMGEVSMATWRFFDDMHEFLGDRPAIQPPVIVASHQADPVNFLVKMEQPSSPEPFTSPSTQVHTTDQTSNRTSPIKLEEPCSPELLPSPSPPVHTTNQTSSTTRRSNPILEFLVEEANQEQRRHEETEAQTQRFLDLFERMVDKL